MGSVIEFKAKQSGKEVAVVELRIESNFVVEGTVSTAVILIENDQERRKENGFSNWKINFQF